VVPGWPRRNREDRPLTLTDVCEVSAERLPEAVKVLIEPAVIEALGDRERAVEMNVAVSMSRFEAMSDEVFLLLEEL